MSNHNSGRKLIALLIKESGSISKVAKELGFSRQYLTLIRDGQRPISEEVRRAVYLGYPHNRDIIRLVRRLHDRALHTKS